MSERLSKEQLDAVRGAVASLDQLYADHPQLRGSRFEENQILFESLTSNSVTIRALLAHIDALEAELEAATFAVDPPLDNKPTVIRRFRLTEVSSEDEAE